MGDGMQHTGDLRRVKIAKDNLSGCVVMLFASVAERESSCIKSLLTHSRQQSLARSERDRGHTPKTLILICGCCAAPVPLSRLLQYCTSVVAVAYIYTYARRHLYAVLWLAYIAPYSVATVLRRERCHRYSLACRLAACIALACRLAV